jgi:ribosomal protein L32
MTILSGGRRASCAWMRHIRLSGGLAFAATMPAKGMCPQCGHKMRGPSHLCDPTKIQREKARTAALAKLTQK